MVQLVSALCWFMVLIPEGVLVHASIFHHHHHLIKSPYKPVRQPTCPPAPIIRPATGISPGEAAYLRGRVPKASAALEAWLHRINPGFKGAPRMPILAMSQSGGGYRALLTAAGVIQGLDGREGHEGVSGIYQALTYQAGLSGGSWLLASLMGNDWPTISQLKGGWASKFADGLFHQLKHKSLWHDVAAKTFAGFHPSIVDPWGRALSYQLLPGPRGGADITLSSIANAPSFAAHAVPYPIISAIQTDARPGQCLTPSGSPHFEFHPFEFGSWDPGVHAFASSDMLGSHPGRWHKKTMHCVKNMDNLGYVLGMSSNLINNLCSRDPVSKLTGHAAFVARVLSPVTDPKWLYGLIPNPFRRSGLSPAIERNRFLKLVDGGESHENIPLRPFVQPDRHIDVLILSDNSGNVGHLPNGSSLFESFENTGAGASKLPSIPPPAVIEGKSLHKRPVFFGCREKSKMTVLWLPNSVYTFPSGQSTTKLKYNVTETLGMINNGVHVATHGGDKNWPMCLACGIMQKELPEFSPACKGCLAEYCFS